MTCCDVICWALGIWAVAAVTTLMLYPLAVALALKIINRGGGKHMNCALCGKQIKNDEQLCANCEQALREAEDNDVYFGGCHEIKSENHH